MSDRCSSGGTHCARSFLNWLCVSLWCSYYVSTCVWHVFLINWWWCTRLNYTLGLLGAEVWSLVQNGNVCVCVWGGGVFVNTITLEQFDYNHPEIFLWEQVMIKSLDEYFWSYISGLNNTKMPLHHQHANIFIKISVILISYFNSYNTISKS